MARKADKTIKICMICGDKAKGVNFNVLTCMSCKAFFRRNALRKNDMKCPFNDTCQIDKITRKFCSKCRLKKCFDCGMKKEWILSEEEKQLIKEKIIQNKLRKQQMEIERNNMIDRSLKNPDDPLSATTTSSKITTTTTTTITTKTITKKSIRNQKTSSKNSEHPRKRVSNIENANDCVGIYRMGLIEDRPKSLMMTNNHMLVSKTKPNLSPSKSKSISTNRSYRSRKKLFESTRYKEDDEKNRFIKSKKNDRSSSSRRLDYNRKLDRSNLFLQQYQNHFDENAVQMINYHCDQSSDSNFAPFEPIDSFSRRNKPEPYSIPSPYTFSTSSPDLPHQQQNHYYHHHHHQQHQFNQNLSIGNEEYWKDGNLYLDFFPRKNNHFNVSNRQSFGQCCSSSSEIFSPSSSSSSSSPSLSSIGSSSLNIANTLPSKLFHEPSAYSLDTLLTSDESDAFFDDSLDSSIYNQNFAWPNSTENCSNHWNENYEKNIAHIEHKISNEIFNPTINQTQNTVYNNSNCCKDLNSFQTSSSSAENIALKQIIVNTDESLNIHNNLNDEIKMVIETNNNQENLKRPNESIRLLSSSINQNRNYSTMIDSDSIQSDQMSSELKSAKQPTQPVLSVHLSDMHERNHSKSSTNDDNKIEKTSCQRNLLEANDFVKNSSDSNKNLEISTSFTDEFLPNYIDDLFDSLDCLKYSEANASSGPNVIESNETKVDSQKQVKDSDEILNYRNKIGEKNIDSNNADDYGYDCDQSSISKSIVSSSALNDLDTKQIESDLFDFNYDDLITHIIDEKNLLLSNEIEMISFDDGDKWEKKIDLLVAKPNLTRESIEDFVCFARKPSRFDEGNSKDKTSIVIDKGEMKKIDDFSQYLLHDNDPPLISQQYGQSQLSSSSFLQHHHHKDIRNQRLTTLSKRKSSETNHNRFKINFLENSSQREESIIPSAIVFENVSHKNSCNRSENKSIPFFGLENNHSLSIDNDDGGDYSRFGNSKKFRIYDDVDYYDLSYENDAAAVDVEDVICDGAMMDSLDYPRTVLNAKHNQNQANDLFDYNHQHHHDQYDLDRSRSFQNFRNSLPISIQSSIDRWILSSLTIADRCLIQELSIACSILKNPYKRIVYKSSSYNHNCMVTEFYIHRLIRMSKRITAFNSLTFSNQLKLLKNGIIEMICLRSVQLYDPDREAWNFLDDKCKLSIMVNVEVIKPCCIKYDFPRHKSFQSRFMHEWKSDEIIFDLLTAIVLFTPRSNLDQFDRIRDEQTRYSDLLQRYLLIKYNDIVEAKKTFKQLIGCIDEIRLLYDDIIHLFVNNTKLKQSPLFDQLLDLDERHHHHHRHHHYHRTRQDHRFHHRNVSNFQSDITSSDSLLTKLIEKSYSNTRDMNNNISEDGIADNSNYNCMKTPKID